MPVSAILPIPFRPAKAPAFRNSGDCFVGPSSTADIDTADADKPLAALPALAKPDIDGAKTSDCATVDNSP